jgi:NadR type nicotinamide-nucleotide adenylyltransferase
VSARGTVGAVVGKFLPPHRGHAYLIDTALDACDHLLVIVADRADDVIPASVRAQWLRELHPAATVVVTPDDIPDDGGDETSRAWAKRTTELALTTFGRAPEVVFTSESYGPRWAMYLGARHISVDPERRRYPVSGTAVRADPWGMAQFLAPCVRAWYGRRVCVVGAESTGTTTLCQDLARHYGVAWVPEYGREYCEWRGGTENWRSDEFETIARGQIAAEDRAAREGGRLLICDTDALATSI